MREKVIDMKKRLFIPITFTALLLSSCQFILPFGPINPSSSGADTTDTSGTATTSEDPKAPVVTSITLNKKNVSLQPGKSTTLTYTIKGENDPDPTVTWTSNNENVATVDAKGVVTVKTTATVGQTAVITATSKVTPSVSASCNVKVSSNQTYTVMMYICGADLESQSGLATSDLEEILKVGSQPENVNIIIETGGASSWQSTYSISSSKLTRWEVRDKKLVSKATLSYASMGLTSTLQSFVEYGITNYSADHMGFIFWNHGGAVNGCCYDEKKSDDSIIASESAAAFKNAFASTGFTGKFDWVGYDCCVMSYADLAAVNSDYFDYMVASQELEAGEGWDYDAWLPTLYADTAVSTETLLSKICDTFVKDNGGDTSSNDQCLGVLNLSYMSELVSAMNTFASKVTSSSQYTTLGSCFTSALRFGKGSSYGQRYDYGLSDMNDFLVKARAQGFDTQACIDALAKITVYSAYSKQYYKSTLPCGVNAFFAPSAKLSGMQIDKENYSTKDTKFTSYQSIISSWGKFY